MNEIPEPEGFSEKEIFAFFGLAAYSAQVLEKNLVNLVLVFDAAGLKITRKQVEELFADYDTKTIGQLLSAARKKRIPIPTKTSELLSKTQKERNYLNHDFFAEHAGHFVTEEGRQLMIGKLIKLTELFQTADSVAAKIYQPLMTKMGLTEELLAKLSIELVAKAKRECG